MEVVLIAILANVVTPLYLRIGFVEGVEGAGAGTYEKQVSRNCGTRVDSTTGFKFPKLLTLRFIRNADSGAFRALHSRVSNGRVG